MKEHIIDFLKRAMPFGVGCAISAFICWLTSSANMIISSVFLMIAVVTGLYFIVYILFIIVPIIFSSCIGLLGKITGKISRKSNVLDKTDFEKNKEYYREILKINSPLIIGYLDNFELDVNKIIAELLYLKKEKIIEIKDGRIEKMDYFKSLDLKFSEKEILNKILVGKLRINNFSDYLPELRDVVARDAERLSLVSGVTSKEKNKNISKLKTILFLIASFVLGTCISMLISSLSGSIDMKVVAACMIFFWPFSMFLLMLPISAFKGEYNKGKGELYNRTSKGRELNQKLEGLKNYLKDYSMIAERESKEIELWDDYLVYSVMFGQNKKIIEEYEKYIEISE